MSEPLARLHRLLRELKRRKVYRTAVVYAVVAFAVWQVADIAFPALGLPSWAITLVVALTLLGFPLALVLAWAFERTPEGVRRTEPAPKGSSFASGLRWIGLALLVLGAGGLWYLTAGGNGGDSLPARAMSGDTADPAVGSSLETSSPPRIAVLPFENISPDSSDAFFADGMHEEVLNQLAKVSGLEVISRTSVMQYADTDIPVPQITEELGGVTALLEGTVRRAGDQIRITTQLIRAPEDVHLWSNTYDRDLSVEGIFRIQADIAERITRALETELTTEERRRIEDVPTSNLSAYDLFLEGRSYWWATRGTRDPDLTERAVEALREAVRQDTTFAEAYAWLGLAYLDRQRFSGQAHWLDSASVAVRRALALDSVSATVQAVRGNLLMWKDSIEAAEVAVRRALELQPNDGFILTALTEVHARRESWTDAVQWAHRVVSVEPRSGRAAAYMGGSLRGADLLEPAEAWMRRLVGLDPPGAPVAWASLARVRLRQGEMSRARAASDSALSLYPDDPVALEIAGSVALHSGDPALAKTRLERIPEARRGPDPRDLGVDVGRGALLGLADLQLGNEESGRALLRIAADSFDVQLNREQQNRSVRLAALGGLLGTLGETEEAFRRLEDAAAEGIPAAAWLRTHPLFDPLRSEPRFQQILDQIDANQQRIQEEVRQMDIELYPPGRAP